MTTQTLVTVVAHSTDAEFRAWGSELSTKLTTVGLVKTSDTGQINWTTVTRPGVNTAAGYEIWRFDDTLQATAPLVLKIEYGTANSAATPSMWVTVGTGSNGSGTIIGQATARQQVTAPQAVGASSYPSYLCALAGHVGLAWKVGAQSGAAGTGLFAVTRTHDAAGVATADGYMFYYGNSTSSPTLTQCVRTAATAVAYAASDAYSIVPGMPASASAGTDFMVYAHFGVSPGVWINPMLATVNVTTTPPNATFSAAMSGGAAKTMLSVGGLFRPLVTFVGPATSSAYGFAMAWE